MTAASCFDQTHGHGSWQVPHFVEANREHPATRCFRSAISPLVRMSHPAGSRRRSRRHAERDAPSRCKWSTTTCRIVDQFFFDTFKSRGESRAWSVSSTRSPIPATSRVCLRTTERRDHVHRIENIDAIAALRVMEGVFKLRSAAVYRVIELDLVRRPFTSIRRATSRLLMTISGPTAGGPRITSRSSFLRLALCRSRSLVSASLAT